MRTPSAVVLAIVAAVAAASYGADYTLTVDSGSGSGTYATGAEVEIVAWQAPANQMFDVWVGDTSAVSTSYLELARATWTQVWARGARSGRKHEDDD